MQTFLPYADFDESARCLDRQRLGKQRVETLQILRTLLGHTDGWKNHPAVKMWRGYERCLLSYGLAMCREWVSRGYTDNCAGVMIDLEDWPPANACAKPFWLGNEGFHASHRSNLLRKNADWYARFGWSESDDLPYVWPDSQQFQDRSKVIPS